MRLNQVTLPATDVAASVAFYRTMGFELIVSTPHYARFAVHGDETTFSVHECSAPLPQSHTIIYFETVALDATVDHLKSLGLTFTTDPTDQPWLWREARLLDPSGNSICLYWAGENRLNPPWRVPKSAA